ncbi:group 1 glycosyl transferase [Flammeovirgaceae bacterium 311]|nr:group 1 glycosyl transferase [Flammeovirgaceae bacterium 311]
MRVVHINEGLGLSETFIVDLALGLSQVYDYEFIASDRAAIKISFKYNITKFIPSSNFLFKKSLDIIGMNYKMRFNQKYAERIIPHLKHKSVAIIEYLSTAVRLRKALISIKIPYVVHVHGQDISSALKWKAYQKEIKIVFQEAYAIIAASNHIKRLLILEGCPSEKIYVIKYGVNPIGITPLSWKDRRKNNPSVIFIGRLTPKKNPIALLHAIKIVSDEIPGVRLTIVGDGPLMPECMNRIQQLGLQQNVTLLGALSRERAFEHLNNHWVYAQHSVTSYLGDQEGFAISIAEAALHELPVVSTIHNGIPENVIDGVTGVLVKEYDYESMAEHIKLLLKNPDMAEKMGKAGRARILEQNIPEVRLKAISKLLLEATC